MSTYDEPTQQVSRPEPPPAPLPGSLDPLRGRWAESDQAEPQEVETGTGWVDTHPTEDRAVDTPTTVEPPTTLETPTAVETPPTGVLPLGEIFESPEPERTPTVTADAPTWTAMPVVPVRTEPVTAGGPGTWTAPHDEAAVEPRAVHPRIDVDDAVARVDGWLRRDDNGLMLLTALVACVLMIVVASVGA